MRDEIIKARQELYDRDRRDDLDVIISPAIRKKYRRSTMKHPNGKTSTLEVGALTSGQVKELAKLARAINCPE